MVMLFASLSHISSEYHAAASISNGPGKAKHQIMGIETVKKTTTCGGWKRKKEDCRIVDNLL